MIIYVKQFYPIRIFYTSSLLGIVQQNKKNKILSNAIDMIFLHKLYAANTTANQRIY